MTVEHGLIRVDALQHEIVPNGAKLFVGIDGVLYSVKRTRRYTRAGFRLTISTPDGSKNISVDPDDFLVISYANLDGAEASTVYAHSRIASLPLRQFERSDFIHDGSCSGLVG